ncbi:MAG: transposase, partial [Planctomycetes bacterium]|nr:transposase [Planctomycetota bacterium]
TWVESPRKNSALFVALLGRIAGASPHARCIHVVLDNWAIHSSWRSQAAPRQIGERLRLLFPPPCCPDENRTERICEDLHAKVTRDDRCRTMENLMLAVRAWVRHRSRRRLCPLRLAA